MLRPGRQTSNGLPTSYGGNSNGFDVGYGGSTEYGGSSSSSQPQRYDPDNKYARRPSQNQSSWMKILLDKVVLLGLLCIVLFGTTLYYRRKEPRILRNLGVDSIPDALVKLNSIHSDRDQWRKDAKRGIQDSRAMEERTRKLETTNRQLEKTNEELKKKLGEGDAAEGHRRTVEHYAKRDVAWRHQVQKLQNATAKESKRAVLEKFGPGPHRVKFSLFLPDDDEVDPNNFFVAEMAPIELMPHAVHLFLEQVSHRLWDETWFYLNGVHVLQAGPQTYEDENDPDDEAKLQEFVERQLDTLTFPEYNVKFPHIQWTMGFTGRPGGPDWYINKNDNTKTHGPGGQRQHALLEQADPCFAKVVEGFGVLEKMFKLDVYEKGVEYSNFFVEPVEIVSARLVETPKEEEKKEEEEKKNEEEKKEEEKEPEAHHLHDKKDQPKKPLISHRTDAEDDDILSDEDWEDEWDEYHYDHHDV